MKSWSMGDELRELGLSIADHGRKEEFHQKRGNYFMYDYHKNQRLILEREYRELKAKTVR